MKKIVDWWTSNLPYPSEISILDREIEMTIDGDKSRKITHSLRERAKQIRGLVAVLAAIFVYASVLIGNSPSVIQLLIATFGLILAILASIKTRVVVSAETTAVTATSATAKVNIDCDDDQD